MPTEKEKKIIEFQAKCGYCSKVFGTVPVIEKTGESEFFLGTIQKLMCACGRGGIFMGIPMNCTFHPVEVSVEDNGKLKREPA